ncbi:hypothetical protein [Sabulibacter ruber]|uniref:hypothetical protein n=1 Tax=Sabulibacter ruber TaxID=2811901 RepID=UPI001A97A2BB|nr:hypothetical protein [Sabulibacter ruber]
MSNERFDKHIREKLESLQPPYQQEAWQTFRQLLPAPWYVLFLRKYGSWLYSGAATVALCTFMYLYFQKQAENEQLQEKIAALQTTTQPADSLTKSAFSNPSPEKALKAEGSSLKQDLTSSSSSGSVYSENRLGAESLAGSETSLARQTEQVATGTALKTNPANDRKGNGKESGINASRTAASQNDSVQASSLQANSIGKKAGQPAADSTSRLSSEQVVPQGAQSMRSDSLQSPVVQDSLGAQAATKQESSEQSGPTRTALRSRLGISGTLDGDRKAAFGPEAEVFLIKRFSLGASLHFSAPTKERYSGIGEYNQQKTRSFENEYPGSVSSHDFYFVTRYDSVGLDSIHYVRYDSVHQVKYDSIHDINLSTKIIRLPLQVNYYFPVKNNLAILLTAGTHLDLSVTRKTAFRSTYQGKERPLAFHQKIPAMTFYNMFYGIGLQYTYRRMVLQIAPYYQHQFRTPTYGNTQPKWGVNASIKLDLRR